MAATASRAGQLYQLADRHRDQLDAQVQAEVDRLTRSYLTTENRAMVEVELLVKKIESARLAGVEPSLAWLYREQRLAGVLSTLRADLATWAPGASEGVRRAAVAAMARGRSDAQALTRQAAAQALPGLEATFVGINPANLHAVTAHLSPHGPLSRLIAGLAGEAAQDAENALIEGITLGKGSDWLTARLRQSLDVPRWRAETIARTEAQRAFREASRLEYQASNVVGSWTWLASIDRRTCVCCVVMDGTTHPLTETLDGHPRCRCAMVPKTLTWAQIDPSLADLPDTSPVPRIGTDWLDAAGADAQRALMGPSKYAAWKSGEVSLGDMVARTHSEKWGTMRRERSLAEIRQGRNANYSAERVAS